uniref:Uncharacterized protein n=1 Tax=Rhizophora mucronata TaxID=61149 RepID=A0A2P2JEC8_RHIMU
MDEKYELSQSITDKEYRSFNFTLIILCVCFRSDDKLFTFEDSQANELDK